MKSSFIYLLLTGILLAPGASAAPQAPAHQVVPVWSGPIPGAIQNPLYNQAVILRDNDPAKPRISQVTTPTLELFLPASDSPTPAVMICPGGGYAVLAYDHEGIQIARWFAERGVAAAILKYRLPHPDIMSDKSVGPLQDAQEGLRVLRRRAAEWGIDPTRLGVMGFSAGGHLAASATTRHAEKVYELADSTSARPDFSILVYGVLSMQRDITHLGSFTNLLGATPDQAAIDRASNELRVDATTPPCFLIHAQNDKAVPVENSLRFYAALTKAGVAGELHIHQLGGHGFGLGVNADSPKHWTADLEVWLRRNRWMP